METPVLLLGTDKKLFRLNGASKGASKKLFRLKGASKDLRKPSKRSVTLLNEIFTNHLKISSRSSGFEKLFDDFREMSCMILALFHVFSP